MTWESKLEGMKPELGNEFPLADAIYEFIQRDAHLLEFGVSERAIAHRLGVYLECRFPENNIDCEYNRNGTLPKNIPNPRKTRELKDQHLISESSTFPDIIVHQRGNNEENRLVVELKIVGRGSSEDRAWDLEKLRAYKNPVGAYKYTTAAFIELGWDKANKIATLNYEVIK